ncbi:MAG: potassium channel family protein [Candidatus Promineifilaceae bacterium]
MRYDDRQDHVRAQEFSKHEGDVLAARKRAREWRLTDCDEATLNRMRHALLDEMDSVEKRLRAADVYFLQCIEASNPLAVDKGAQRLNRISAEWTAHNSHLQDIDHAILERHLRMRLIDVFRTEKRLNRWDSFVLAAIIVVLLITFAEFIWLAIEPAHFSPELVAIDTIICFVLLGDFCLRLWLSEDSSWYLRNYWMDFVASIPFVGILRWGRLVRMARFARLLRLFRLGRAMRSLQSLQRGFDKLEQTFQVHLLRRSFIFGIAMLFIGAIAIYYIEHQPAPDPIKAFSDSFWWSFTTVITGGFADLYNPESDFGRIVTGLLVLVGLVIVSVFTASLTSVLVDDSSKAVERKLFQMQEQMELVTQRLDLLGNETNQGLLAMETIAQQLSNQTTVDGISEILTQTMINSFEAIQSSFHIYRPEQKYLQRIVSTGVRHLQPTERVALGVGFIGSVAAELLDQDLKTIDIEPIDMPCIPVKGTSVACPLVAQGRFLGILHLILPSHLGRFYLYNRAPMTLAHHAAIAIHAAQRDIN